MEIFHNVKKFSSYIKKATEDYITPKVAIGIIVAGSYLMHHQKINDFFKMQAEIYFLGLEAYHEKYFPMPPPIIDSKFFEKQKSQLLLLKLPRQLRQNLKIKPWLCLSLHKSILQNPRFPEEFRARPPPKKSSILTEN